MCHTIFISKYMETPRGAPQKQRYNFEPKKGWTESGEGSAKKRSYQGPVFKIRYPASCDGFREMLAWTGLGYHVPPVTGTFGAETVMTVYGHIPENFRATLEEHGVTFEESNGRIEL